MRIPILMATNNTRRAVTKTKARVENIFKFKKFPS